MGTRYTTAAAWMISLLASACHTTTGLHGASKVAVSGYVYDDKGAAIAGAMLSIGQAGAMATTAADGSYIAEANGTVGASVPVAISHSSHANVATTLYLDAVSVAQNFVLKPYGVTQTVALPTSGGNVSVSHTDGNATVTLTIGAASLVKPDGSAATGEVTVNLTNWSPDTPASTFPAPLQGLVASGNGPYDLYTLGMADIVITQGADELQIAGGSFLELNFTLPPDALAVAANANAADQSSFGLWYADPNVGYWRRTDTLGNGNLSFVASANTVVARIPHLSGWNLDGVPTPNACATGHAIDACGQPLANAALTLWLYSSGQTAQFPVTSNADGSFCTNLVGSADNDQSANRSLTAYFWLSAQNDPNSTFCNPTGKATMADLCTNQAKGFSNSCAGVDLNAPPYARSGQPFTIGADKFSACNIPPVQGPLCGFCPGSNLAGQTCRGSLNGTDNVRSGPLVSGQCVNVGTLKTAYCGSPTTPKACGDRSNLPVAGSPCSSTADCCSSVLICADATCVPKDE